MIQEFTPQLKQHLQKGVKAKIAAAGPESDLQKAYLGAIEKVRYSCKVGNYQLISWITEDTIDLKLVELPVFWPVTHKYRVLELFRAQAV